MGSKHKIKVGSNYVTRLSKQMIQLAAMLGRDVEIDSGALIEIKNLAEEFSSMPADNHISKILGRIEHENYHSIEDLKTMIQSLLAQNDNALNKIMELDIG